MHRTSGNLFSYHFHKIRDTLGAADIAKRFLLFYQNLMERLPGDITMKKENKKSNRISSASRRGGKKEKLCVAMNVSMNNCYYPEWRETARQNRKCARVKWISVMVRYAHRGNMHWHRQREYVINSMKGEKKRDKMAKKSRRMLHFSRVILPRDDASRRRRRGSAAFPRTADFPRFA